MSITNIIKYKAPFLKLWLVLFPVNSSQCNSKQLHELQSLVELALCWLGPQSGHVLSYVQEMLIKSCYCLDIRHRALQSKHSNINFN